MDDQIKKVKCDELLRQYKECLRRQQQMLEYNRCTYIGFLIYFNYECDNN